MGNKEGVPNQQGRQQVVHQLVPALSVSALQESSKVRTNSVSPQDRPWRDNSNMETVANCKKTHCHEKVWKEFSWTHTQRFGAAWWDQSGGFASLHLPWAALCHLWGPLGKSPEASVAWADPVSSDRKETHTLITPEAWVSVSWKTAREHPALPMVSRQVSWPGLVWNMCA
jgi:hypothetical protein